MLVGECHSRGGCRDVLRLSRRPRGDHRQGGIEQDAALAAHLHIVYGGKVASETQKSQINKEKRRTTPQRAVTDTTGLLTFLQAEPSYGCTSATHVGAGVRSSRM